MANIDAEIDGAIRSDGAIPRERVLSWIDQATELRTLSKLYCLTGEGYYRIQPEFGADAICQLIQRYLLECIRQNVEGDDEIQSRFEAATALHRWFRRLHAMKDTNAILHRASEGITELYLKSGEDIRYAIETGFLEHALETVALRPYFESWSADSRLHDAWERALEWGKAHPDYMAKLWDSPTEK